MNITEKIVSGIELREKERKERKGSGKFKPSSFGKCYRRQIFDRLGLEKETSPALNNILIMQDGTDKHKFIQSFYPPECCEVKFEDEHFKGFADIVDGDCVGDIKTVDTASFNKLCSKNYSIYQNKEHYVLQVVFYANRLNKPLSELIFVDREEFSRSGDLKIKQFSFDTPFHSLMVKKEVDNLLEFWYNVCASGKLPEIAPRLFFGNECGFCEYKMECNKRKEGE